MPKTTIHLGSLRIPITDFASQGNAILGIRDSGKSYTATYLAEQLLDVGIPFVAFDPVGIWRFLRVAGKGHAYPVVVAGGRNGDLPLTPQSAPEIVRAAMKENLPLILDLYSMQLSKADWKRIVESSVRLLLYENGDYGLRHIFLEEAAEFAPQRIGPDQGAVYAEIEKLARMGGNALLGYTLINQRAEEVNKAVLELCDCLFLHRQKGRNSLTALSKWLDIGDVAEARPILKSLPTLPQGECWVWPAGSDTPVRVKVPVKNTAHPDRRALSQATAQGKGWDALDVSAFVSQMSAALEQHLAAARENDPAELRRRIAELQKQLKQAQSAAPAPVVERVEVPVVTDDQIQRIEHLTNQLAALDQSLRDSINPLSKAVLDAYSPIIDNLRAYRQALARPAGAAVPVALRAPQPRATQPSAPGGELPSGARRMLQTLAQRHPLKLTRSQLGTLAGFTPSGGTFSNYFSNLKRLGYIVERGSDVEMTQAGLDYIGADVPPAPSSLDEELVLWKKRLPAGAAKMLDLLVAAYPGTMTRQELGEQAGFAASGGTFGNYLGLLRRNGLVAVQGANVNAHPDLFTFREM